MKQKLKQLAKIGFLPFVILLILISCQKNENVVIEEGHGVLKPNPKSSMNYNTFLEKFGNNSSSKLYQNSKQFSLENYSFGSPSNIMAREEEQSIIHYIDTTTIVAFEFDYIQTYTFKVIPTIETENTFYNIIFYQNTEGVQSKLLKYECDFDYTTNIDSPFAGTIYEIEEDETVINTYTAANSTTSTTSRLITDCAYVPRTVSVNCTGEGLNGEPQNHGPDDDCSCGVTNFTCSPPYTFTVTDLVCITYDTGGGGSSDDDITGGGTSTNDPNQNNDGTFNLPTDPVREEVDLEEIGRRRECKKISDLLDDNPTYLQKIQNIATKVSEDREYSLSIHEDGSEYEEVGTVGSGGIEYPEYSSQYKFHMHTHDRHGENGQGTLSVYSIEDLIMYAKLAYHNKLDSDTFVAFLATDDGTKYALTINDQDKLIDLFYDRLEIPLTINNVIKYGVNTQKVEDLFDEYYKLENINRKLKVDSQNPGNDLVHFLNLLEEGDMGVSVFESTDNFQTFENVKLPNNSNTTINRKPCN